MALRRVVSTWLPAVAWAGVIFALSSVPGLGTGLGAWDLILRKLAHVGQYAVFGLLLARAAAPLPAFGLGFAYAITDELHQSFVPGRQAAVHDVAFDAVGLVVGIAAWRRLAR